MFVNQLGEASISLGAGLKQNGSEETGLSCKCQKQISTLEIKSPVNVKVRSR